MPFAKPPAVPLGLEQARNEVRHEALDPQAEDTEHHQVRVSDHPVGEVDERLKGQRHLQGTLEAGEEVENHARIEPADRQVGDDRAPVPSIVMKKFTMTVVTTSSTAIVDMIAPYCRNMGIGV